MDNKYIEKYKGKKLVVIGAGESGVGAAVLGMALGMDVWLTDSGEIPAKYREMILERGIPYEEKSHTESRILDADICVKSPGVPPTVPLVRKITEKGIPVLSEIEFAGRFTDARMVCITGSNGKTTTTLLTYHILSDAGLDVGLAGNVGKSLALQVAEDPHEIYVIELSSFQLENMYDFKADIAVIMNITPDHLDRYDYKMERYVDAKLRIVRNMRPCDTFIHWADDPVVMARDPRALTPAADRLFAIAAAPGLAACFSDGSLMLDGKPLMPEADLSLPGEHNRLNSMAAALAAESMGASREAIAEALATFAPVEHRLEPAGTVDGVRWINDSKATNVNSTWYALESMTSPTVLILGGKDKGNDYTEIERLVADKVKAIVCMGKDNAKLLDFFAGKVPEIRDTHSIEDAVSACAEIAAEGDTVLLSPCCASFDLFKSYEDRGEQFKRLVRAMEASAGAEGDAI